jgi:hypothetical protein
MSTLLDFLTVLVRTRPILAVGYEAGRRDIVESSGGGRVGDGLLDVVWRWQVVVVMRGWMSACFFVVAGVGDAARALSRDVAGLGGHGWKVQWAIGIIPQPPARLTFRSLLGHYKIYMLMSFVWKIPSRGIEYFSGCDVCNKHQSTSMENKGRLEGN